MGCAVDDLIPADEALFVTRSDANDPRLGDVVKRSAADYD